MVKNNNIFTARIIDSYWNRSGSLTIKYLWEGNKTQEKFYFGTTREIIDLLQINDSIDLIGKLIDLDDKHNILKIYERVKRVNS